MTTKRFAAISVLALLLVLSACSGGLMPQQDGSGAATAPVEGALAPDLMLQDLDGELIKLSDLRGRPVLLNFWTTWCGYCRAERSTLQQLHEQYGEDELAVLAVAIGEDRTLLRSFVREQGLTYSILLDEDGRVSRSYKVRGIPASFFIDREGVIQAQHVGALAEEVLTAYLQKVQ